MSTHTEQLGHALEQLGQQRHALDGYRQAYAGERPAAYMSKKSRDALDSGLSRLGANYPRMLVRTMTDRLRLDGFRRGEELDAGSWELYRSVGLVPAADRIHADRLLYGSSYVTVWGHERDPRRPVAVADSPLTVAADVDPATGEVYSAVRSWEHAGSTHAVTYAPDVIRRYHIGMTDAPAGASAWKLVAELDNPFGLVPVTPFIRRTSSDDYAGTSLVADVLDLSDAVAKVLQDALVTSEHAARPRRWATGLEIEEDEDGNVIDPFANDRKLQSESPDTKFGQLAPASLDGYGVMLTALLQQLGAVSGLPAHYIGTTGNEPPNADSIRAAEAQLTTAAYGEMRQLDAPWARTAGLLHAVKNPDELDAEQLAHELTPVWASPEVRTPAQAADAALKLSSIGVPLRSLLVDTLGYTPEAADAVNRAAQAESITRAAEQLGRLRP